MNVFLNNTKKNIYIFGNLEFNVTETLHIVCASILRLCTEHLIGVKSHRLAPDVTSHAHSLLAIPSFFIFILQHNTLFKVVDKQIIFDPKITVTCSFIVLHK